MPDLHVIRKSAMHHFAAEPARRWCVTPLCRTALSLQLSLEVCLPDQLLVANPPLSLEAAGVRAPIASFPATDPVCPPV